jgi:hypothetical protein
MIDFSTPPIDKFTPLPSQFEVIKYLRKNADYKTGTKEVLLSGSVGSSKSLTLAHMVVTHALIYQNSKVGIGRLALPQLKATLCQKIKEHLYDTGIDYHYHESSGDFKFSNGSTIKAVSWADGNLAKLGSMEFSAFAIEELTETKESRPYDVILQRTNRLPHVKEPWVLSASNPDGPSHWVYEKIIMANEPNVKVFYSNTFDNPYLDKSYIERLKSRLDDKMAQRMIYGRWVEIATEVVYYAYSDENYRPVDYQIDLKYPIRIHFDFNIGDGKPLSVVLSQYHNETDTWHFFDEVIIDGSRTLDAMDELSSRGLLNLDQLYIIHGDATGQSRDTRSKLSDYDIIKNFLSNHDTKTGKLRFRVDVPRTNPPLRKRHNIVNAYCKNAMGQHKLFVYKKAKTLDKGMRLTRLKSGGNYIENDSDRWQHCTTALGYGICYQAELNQYGQTTAKSLGGY